MGMFSRVSPWFFDFLSRSQEVLSIHGFPGESSERTRQDDFLGARHLPEIAEDRGVAAIHCNSPSYFLATETAMEIAY